MGIGKLFKKDFAISSRHSERVDAVAKWRDELASRRQELAWEHQRKVAALEAGAGKELADFEASVRDFETKHEETIASETLGALRNAASLFGDQPRTATIAIRDTWRAYGRRVADELAGEPNYLLLAAAFLDVDVEPALGTQAFLESRTVAADLANAMSALAGESTPRTTYALQQLNIAVDETSRTVMRDANEASAKTARHIISSATHTTMSSRVTLGDALTGLIGSALHRLADAAPPPPPPPEVVKPAITSEPDFVPPTDEDVESALAYGG